MNNKNIVSEPTTTLTMKLFSEARYVYQLLVNDFMKEKQQMSRDAFLRLLRERDSYRLCTEMSSSLNFRFGLENISPNKWLELTDSKQKEILFFGKDLPKDLVEES